MKLSGTIVFIFGCFIYVQCEQFVVRSKITGGACIMLNLDAAFNLTYTNGNETEKAPIFTMKGAKVDEDSSSCGNVFVGTTSVLSTRLFPSRELLMFTFERQNGEVAMAVRFTLSAEKHFKHMNFTTPIQLNDEKDLPLGSDARNSFLCKAQEEIKFKPNNNFHQTMMITNLQVQAYRITGSKFGPVTECSQDSATSTPLPVTTVGPQNETTTSSQPETTTEIQPNTTTEPQPETTTQPEPETTTEPHSNVTTEPNPFTTTEPHSNMTTEPEPETTTQPEPETTTMIQPETTTETTTVMNPTTSEPPLTSKYVVRDNGEVCIVLQGSIKFDIPFQLKDGGTDTATVTLPPRVTVTGNCSYTDTEQDISLSFFNPPWTLDIVIAKGSRTVSQTKSASLGATSTTSDYSWQAVTLTYVVDSHFPNAKKQGDKMKAVADGTFGKFKGNTDGSYKCDAEQDIEFGKDKKFKMDLSKMQYRAFGKTNSTDFSNTGVSECPADDSNNGGGDHKTLGIALGCAFAGLVVIVFVACAITKYRKRKQREEGPYEHIN